jgi:hypothetical protein
MQHLSEKGGKGDGLAPSVPSLSVKSGVADLLDSDEVSVDATLAVGSGQSARIDSLLAVIATAQMENGRLSAEVAAQQKDIEGLRQYRVNVKAKDARIENLEVSEASLKAELAFLKIQVCVLPRIPVCMVRLNFAPRRSACGICWSPPIRGFRSTRSGS